MALKIISNPRVDSVRDFSVSFFSQIVLSFFSSLHSRESRTTCCFVVLGPLGF